MKQLQNEQMTISVKEHGAELASIVCGGKEYLWQADEKFWKRHSPVLFPIVGSVCKGEYRSHGKTYKMGQHGLARDLDFTLISATDNELWYELSSTPETLEKYPYSFCLRIGYRLEGKRISVMWKVVNTGEETMAFQIGAHPAFFFADPEKRGFFRLSTQQRTLPISVITEGGNVGGTSEITTDEEGFIVIDDHTFDHDALVFEDSLLNKVELCREDRTPYVTVEFTSPLVGLWSPPHKHAPFVCIEPWYGRTDPAGYTGTLEEKPWMQHLAPNEIFEASYDIIIND
ncbi:MAG: aldose 1-epimerase family protein [Bacteroidales bacterium]|nr:aldose 1-epimerase family protein [Bacteroidales bacterium]